MSIHRIGGVSKLCARAGTTRVLAWVGIPHITVRPRFSLWTSGMGRVDQAALHPLWPPMPAGLSALCAGAACAASLTHVPALYGTVPHQHAYAQRHASQGEAPDDRCVVGLTALLVVPHSVVPRGGDMAHSGSWNILFLCSGRSW